jgi:hypothetical protein
MSETKVIIIIVLLFIIAVLPFPTGLLIYKFKSEKLKKQYADEAKKADESEDSNKSVK